MFIIFVILCFLVGSWDLVYYFRKGLRLFVLSQVFYDLRHHTKSTFFIDNLAREIEQPEDPLIAEVRKFFDLCPGFRFEDDVHRLVLFKYVGDEKLITSQSRVIFEQPLCGKNMDGVSLVDIDGLRRALWCYQVWDILKLIIIQCCLIFIFYIRSGYHPTDNVI
jgi:hypothetical protein